MENSKFEEYLKREKIECTFQIEDNYLKIFNDHTVYCELRKDNHPTSKNELIGQIKEIKELAKLMGLKVRGEKKVREAINENIEAYEQNIKWCNEFFDNICDLATHIEKRGLHYGTCDDRELNLLIDNVHRVQESRNNIHSGRYKIDQIKSNLDYIICAINRPYYKSTEIRIA